MGQKTFVAVCLVGTLAMGAGAWADVTVERTVRASVVQGVGGTDGTYTEKISGSRKREVSSTKLSGGVGGLFSKIAGPTGSDAIIDVEKDVVWRLDHKKKTYTETPITPAAEDLRKEEAGERPREPAKAEESDVRVVRNEVSVKESGEKKTINGFDCARYLVTWLLETENVKTKERATSRMTLDLWNTPETKETRALTKEEEAFGQSYRKKLGLDPSAAEAKSFGLGAVTTLFGGDTQARDEGLKKVQAEMEKVKGFSIAKTVRWEAGESSKAGEAEAKAPPPQEEPAPAGLGGFLSGLAKKVAKGADTAEEPKPTNALFESYIEIRKIDLAAVPAAEFQVPAGYKKVQ